MKRCTRCWRPSSRSPTFERRQGLGGTELRLYRCKTCAHASPQPRFLMRVLIVIASALRLRAASRSAATRNRAGSRSRQGPLEVALSERPQQARRTYSEPLAGGGSRLRDSVLDLAAVHRGERLRQGPSPGRPAAPGRTSAIYEEQVGPDPEGLELDHLCCVTACVNPDHLEPVTRAREYAARSNRRMQHVCLTESPIYTDGPRRLVAGALPFSSTSAGSRRSASRRVDPRGTLSRLALQLGSLRGAHGARAAARGAAHDLAAARPGVGRAAGPEPRGLGRCSTRCRAAGIPTGRSSRALRAGT